MGKQTFFACCILICSTSLLAQPHEGEQMYFREQNSLIMQQKSFAIEDLLFEMEALRTKVDNGVASDYEKFKLKKLEKRLEDIQNGTL